MYYHRTWYRSPDLCFTISMQQLGLYRWWEAVYILTWSQAIIVESTDAESCHVSHIQLSLHTVGKIRKTSHQLAGAGWRCGCGCGCNRWRCGCGCGCGCGRWLSHCHGRAGSPTAKAVVDVWRHLDWGEEHSCQSAPQSVSAKITDCYSSRQSKCNYFIDIGTTQTIWTEISSIIWEQ